MITAVDTSVLIDIFGADAKFGSRSAELMRQCLLEGAVIACEVVWAETGVIFGRERDFLEAMENLGVGYSALQQKAALAAARAWRTYRSRGGRRQRVAADFLVGAHALDYADRLLTRDRGFYRDHFEKLRVLDPAESA
jgi:predicted nucleic acid-binding protein